MSLVRSHLVLVSLSPLACGLDSAGVEAPATETSTGGDPTGEPVVPTGEQEFSTGVASLTTSTSDTTADGGTTTTTNDGPFCGDGVVDDGEGCDDGDANKPYAACTDACQPNVCGDGKVLTGVEACDQGADNLDTGACRSDCQLNVCGDGYLNEGIEECDAGVMNGPAYGQCDEACTINRCGDGTLDAGHEVCDAGEANGSGRPIEGGMSGCDDECGFDGRWLFLSSLKFYGDMEKRAGADKACQAMAEAAQHKHPKRFLAFLADAEGSPNDFVLPDAAGRPFILPSGLLLADSYDELIADGPGLGVTTTETGEYMLNQLVWTNVDPFGDAFETQSMWTCSGWNSDDSLQSAQVGLNAVMPGTPEFAEWLSKGRWLSYSSKPCADPYRIYCIEALVEGD